MKVCRRTPLNAGLAGVDGVGRSVHRALTAPTPAATPVQPRCVCPAAGVVRTVGGPLGLHCLVWRLAWMWEWKKSRKADEIGSSSSCRPVSECCFVLLGVGPSKAAASCPVWPWVLCGLAVTWGFRGAPGAEWEAKGMRGLMGDTPGLRARVCVCVHACARLLCWKVLHPLSEGLTEHFPVVSFNCYCSLRCGEHHPDFAWNRLEWKGFRESHVPCMWWNQNLNYADTLLSTWPECHC